MRILAICGSLKAESANRRLLTVAAASASPGVAVILSDALRALPHFDPDLEANDVPASVAQWRDEVAGADALLIASPEYPHSPPGVLTNGIDWLLGSGELERTVIANTAAVPGPGRGRRGLQALRDTLAAVSATIVGGEPIPVGPDFERHVRILVRDLIEVAARSTSERRP
jgi:NAD(P)H-dependent FMN reductase